MDNTYCGVEKLFFPDYKKGVQIKSLSYIGAKTSLLNFIRSTITAVIGDEDIGKYSFTDLFAGTGTVGAFFRSLGCKVISNDLQYYSYVIIKHLIEANPNDVDPQLLDHLNHLTGIDGFVYNNFCLGSGSERQYFSDVNGRKCDAIRTEIERLYSTGEITLKNYYYCLASLLIGLDKCANTTSVYGAFLKHLDSAAKKYLMLIPVDTLDGPVGKVYNGDALTVIQDISGDILYLDPPYNARQYCSNYHVLETVAKYDNPVLSGVTGIRPVEDQKSDFCSKRLVKQSFETLIKNANYKYIFMSYNNEGILPVDDIKEIMSQYGRYSVYTQNYKRFKADSDENRNIKANGVVEYLHCLVKD